MSNNSPDNLGTPPVSPPAHFAVRAEQELKELLDSDPELRAQWEQASLHAKAFAESLQEAAKSPEFQEVQAALKDRRATQEVRERFEAAQRALQNVCDMLERLHLGRPETLQDWAHLGRVTEMSEERLLAGDYTVREVFEHAMAWVHRQIARARLEYEARPPHAEPSPAEQNPVEEGKTLADAAGNDSVIALARVLTDGVADARIKRAAQLLSDAQLTINEKLTKIDALVPFPPTVSAERLGGMLGVTKQAILKTAWWIQNRKGEKESEIGRRRERHHERARDYESPSQDDGE